MPVRLNVGEAPEEAHEFDVAWTPALLVLDHRGKAQYRFDGYLPADEFVPMLLIAEAQTAFRLRCYAEAQAVYERVPTQHPGSRFVPEALYYLAAARLSAGDRAGGLALWRQLQRDYPDSLWALRVPLKEPGRAAA